MAIVLYVTRSNSKAQLRNVNNNNNNIHISIPPWVVTSEAVVAQVTSLLFDMSQIKKISLEPGFEDCY